MRMGQYPGSVPAYPYTPGRHRRGRGGVASGTHGLKWEPGWPRIGLGGYTEFICLPEKDLVAFPNGLDPADVVCLVLNYLTAYQMLLRFADLHPRESILVHACGHAGLARPAPAGKLHLQMYGTASLGKHGVVSSLGVFPSTIDKRTSFDACASSGQAASLRPLTPSEDRIFGDPSAPSAQAAG
jgi:NADPH2:quinone reductase